MDNVVYLLGAGFSAPLGIPLISNFRSKSEDMFLRDSARFAHFRQVFDKVFSMSVSKNYYNTNLYNIEEVLSILEMADYIEGNSLKEEFIQYIKDVIAYYTPAIPPYPGRLPSNWPEFIFGNDTKWKSIGEFFANILQLEIAYTSSVRTGNNKEIVCTSVTKPTANYSVLTLNYDLVPEMVVDFLNETYTAKKPISFVRSRTDYDDTRYFSDHGPVYLAKLHGSADSDTIVPPTWSKGANKDIMPAWNIAHTVLSKATHLRIIGYSLPVADAYIKYLLKSAVLKQPFIKHIDVICIDTDGSVKRRYDEFIEFAFYRFVNASFMEMLSFGSLKSSDAMAASSVVFDQLENVHERFMFART